MTREECVLGMRATYYLDPPLNSRTLSGTIVGITPKRIRFKPDGSLTIRDVKPHSLDKLPDTAQS